MFLVWLGSLADMVSRYHDILIVAAAGFLPMRELGAGSARLIAAADAVDQVAGVRGNRVKVIGELAQVGCAETELIDDRAAGLSGVRVASLGKVSGQNIGRGAVGLGMTHQLYERDLGSLYLDFAPAHLDDDEPLSP